MALRGRDRKPYYESSSPFPPDCRHNNSKTLERISCGDRVFPIRLSGFAMLHKPPASLPGWSLPLWGIISCDRCDGRS
jgi:hypothetical protein